MHVLLYELADGSLLRQIPRSLLYASAGGILLGRCATHLCLVVDSLQNLDKRAEKATIFSPTGIIGCSRAS